MKGKKKHGGQRLEPTSIVCVIHCERMVPRMQPQWGTARVGLESSGNRIPSVALHSVFRGLVPFLLAQQRFSITALVADGEEFKVPFHFPDLPVVVY